VDGDGDLDWLMVLQNTFDPNTQEVCAFAYWYFSGTSMAAPHVSGVAALLLSENPLLTHEEIRQILKDTADQNTDSACGSGLINALAALQAVTPVDTPPEVSIDYPTDGETVFGTVTVQIDASDFNDAPGTLTVEWSLNGDTWKPVGYNSASGFYEATWETALYAEDNHTLQSRATDSADQTTESALITVTVNNTNEAPVASFEYDCNGSICEFDAAGSYDTDGSIESYEWDFGDGSTGSGIAPSHTFMAEGNYTVTLTVTDDIGAKASFPQEIPIEVVTNTLHVADLDATSANLFWGFWSTTVTIIVKDAGNNPVANANVYGVFSDGSTLFTCTTGVSGTCQVTGYQWTLNCLTYTVVDVTHVTLIYRAEENSDPDGDSDGTEITSCRP
jgi:PKD repeat protein